MIFFGGGGRGGGSSFMKVWSSKYRAQTAGNHTSKEIFGCPPDCKQVNGTFRIQEPPCPGSVEEILVLCWPGAAQLSSWLH